VQLNNTDCLTQLKSLVKAGSVLIGFEVPLNFTNRIFSGEQSSLVYYVDESEPALASLASLILANGLVNYKSEILANSEDELHKTASDARARLNEITNLLNITLQSVKSSRELLGLAYPLINNYLTDLYSKLLSYDTKIGFIQNLKVDFLINPIKLLQGRVQDVTNPSGFNFGITFCIVSLFTLLLLSSSGFLFDQKTNYLLRLKVTKTPIPLYLISKVLFYLSISGLQFIIIMLLMLAQGAVFNFDLGAIIHSVIIITSINTLLGLLIGVLAKTENVAILTSLVISLPFLFLSGSLVPLELMPAYLQFIANIFPFRVEASLLKQVSVLGVTATPLFTYLWIFVIVLFAINYFILKFRS
jgi:ABC-type multidrug transport system permease subunit